MHKVRISVINTDRYFDNDRLFDVHAGHGDDLEQFRRLKEVLEFQGSEIHTSDILPPDDADIIIFLEVPASRMLNRRASPADYPNKRCFLFLFECRLLRPNNFKRKFHVGYERVFTWDDDLITSNSNVYSKINFSQVFGSRVSLPLSERTGFIALVSGNKKLSGNGELYSQRLNAIRFYEKMHPDSFSLFGTGWHQFRVKSNTVLRPLNYLFRKIPDIKGLRPSYEGPVVDKLATLKNFRFNLCFENFSGQNGYITEKIFHSFAAGCVPVYWGPDNIEEYIPSTTFIDYRKFKNVAECHDFLWNLSETDLLKYESEITKFLSSDGKEHFSVDTFVSSIVECLSKPVQHLNARAPMA